MDALNNVDFVVITFGPKPLRSFKHKHPNTEPIAGSKYSLEELLDELGVKNSPYRLVDARQYARDPSHTGTAKYVLSRLSDRPELYGSGATSLLLWQLRERAGKFREIAMAYVNKQPGADDGTTNNGGWGLHIHFLERSWTRRWCGRIARGFSGT